MKELSGRVAVVTGAASGIGRALAERLGAEGMKLVLADVESAPLEQARNDLEKQGVEALGVRTDVTQPDQVSSLAERALERFGAVHVICNNAGVFAGGTSWGAPLSDYEWVLGVNVWGVIHGIRTFVPILLEQDEGHVVNTASMAGVTSGPLAGAYYMSKHAVLSLSETLYFELQQRNASVGVSALCPEVIATRIGDGERNRPEHLARKDDDPQPERDMVEGAIRQVVREGLPPSEMANRVVDAIRSDRFYIFPPEGDPWRVAADSRCEDVRLARNPTHVVPAAAAEAAAGS